MIYTDTNIGEVFDMGDIDNRFFLIGLLSEFSNRYQVVADGFFEEISWKQCFVIICLQFFQEPPTLKELSDMMGSSHQNVKQLLLKLERLGFVKFVADVEDRRKQRILLTAKAQHFSEEHNEGSNRCVDQLFQTIDEESLLITIKTILKLDEKLKIMQREKKEVLI